MNYIADPIKFLPKTINFSRLFARKKVENCKRIF